MVGVDVFQRLGPISGRVQPQKKNVFERLGPVSGRVRKSQPQKANVFHRLGPVSGNVQSKNLQKSVNIFERLGPNSNKVQKRQRKKSAFKSIKSVSGVFESSRPLVDYSGVHDSRPQHTPVVEKKHKKEEVKCKRILPTTSPCFSSFAQLEGHQNAITGIAFPTGSDKILTGSKDKNVRIWDCKSGNCVTTIDLDSEVGCMNCEGSCILVGTANSIKIWNTQTSEEYTLAKSSSEQVHAIAVIRDRVFAGVQGGDILSWRFDAATKSFKPAASLTGHTSSVVSLAAGPNKLYSGSSDKTIRIWNVETSECEQVLTGHYNSVTSLIAVENNIVSCSLDGTIKAWTEENGKFEVKLTQTEEWGLQSMCWTSDLEGKPVLLCSSDDDKTVRAYAIPSFTERGRIYSEEEVLSIQSGPPGMFFTGDATGHVKVWKWSGTTSKATK